MEDRFAKPYVTKSGVHWNPRDYKEMDQTPYLEYLDKNDAKTRSQQGLYTEEELRVLLGIVEASQKT